MYIPSDTRLEWLGEGPLFKSDSNKHWRDKMGPLLITPHLPFEIVTIQDKTKCQGFSSMMVRCISCEINTFQRIP